MIEPTNNEKIEVTISRMVSRDSTHHTAEAGIVGDYKDTRNVHNINIRKTVRKHLDKKPSISERCFNV